MRSWKFAVTLTAIAAVGGISQTATAQLPGGLGGAAQAQQRAQAQVQQRIQAQAQQRAQAQAQAQVQSQVQAQVQARLQAEAARAASIAQQTINATRRQAAAAQGRVPNGATVRLGANANVANETRIGNQSASANARARLGVEAGLMLPPDITTEDVAIYDNIFGRFNPLRPQPAPEQPEQPVNDTATPDQTAQDPPDSRRPANDRNGRAWSEFDLGTRIEMASRHRRAEISQMRDRALATGDAQLLVHAQRMEETMAAFVEAQARARSQAEATAQRRPSGVVPPARPNRPSGPEDGDTQGDQPQNPRSATRPGVSTQNRDRVGGSGSVGQPR